MRVPYSMLHPMPYPMLHPMLHPMLYSMQHMMSWSQSSLLSAPTSVPLNMASSSYSLPPSAPFLTAPADTSLKENADTAKRIVEQCQLQVAPPPHRKDMNVEFPPGLFPPEKEIDLEGSHQVSLSSTCTTVYKIVNHGFMGRGWYLGFSFQAKHKKV